MIETIRFNPYHEDFAGNPYPQYHELRQQDPVHKSFMGTWVLTRYDDILSLLKDSNFSSDLRSWKDFDRRYRKKESVSWMLNRSVLNQDPPQHTGLKQVIVKAFTPASQRYLENEIENTVNHCLDQLEHKGHAFDAISEFALRIPVEILCNIYNIEHELRTQVKQWSVAVSQLIEPLPTGKTLDQAKASINDFSSYLQQRLQQEADSTFIGNMIEAIQSDKISEQHALANLLLMFPAGHETTVNLIGNGLYSLLKHPQQMAALINTPNAIDTALEEILRFESPQQLVWRSALDDCQIGGVDISKGEQVMGLLGAANRDPDVFERPDTFDIVRNPNPHLAFGIGLHSCLGSWFAKLQAKTTLMMILQRFPKLELVQPEPIWHTTLSFHGLQSMWVTPEMTTAIKSHASTSFR